MNYRSPLRLIWKVTLSSAAVLSVKQLLLLFYLRNFTLQKHNGEKRFGDGKCLQEQLQRNVNKVEKK